MANEVYVITKAGVQELIGKDGDAIREQIAQGANHQDFLFYDDDRKAWTPWVVKDGDGKIMPLTFLAPENYGLTSAELYAKTVTYATLLTQVMLIINRKAPTLWEKLMKPTTVIGAIVLIVLIMIIGVVALQG